MEQIPELNGALTTLIDALAREKKLEHELSNPPAEAVESLDAYRKKREVKLQKASWKVEEQSRRLWRFTHREVVACLSKLKEKTLIDPSPYEIEAIAQLEKDGFPFTPSSAS